MMLDSGQFGSLRDNRIMVVIHISHFSSPFFLFAVSPNVEPGRIFNGNLRAGPLI
jgi:hypothetical protein